MLLFDTKFIKDFSKDIYRLRAFLPLLSRYFKTLALIESYNYMVQLVEERVPNHPEVLRAPELKDMLIQHFYENVEKHIDIDQERIFNIHLVGTDSTVRQWQEAGYPARRTAKNYSKRLEYWKAIYDNQTIKVKKRIKKSKNYKMKPRTGEDIFGVLAVPEDISIVYEVHVKDRTGKIVTYDDVIKSRNQKFGASKKLIPFWIPLNYGTDNGFQPGYPTVPGLHFIEDAEKTIPQRLSSYASLFEKFMFDMLDNTSSISSDDVALVENWTKSNIQVDASRINPFDFAREHVYGVPF